MKILVTGGAGYIGAAAAKLLLDDGHAVTVYDSLVTGHRQAVPDTADFVQADLADQGQLAGTLERGRFDAVMHFAAFIEAGESMQNPPKYFHNNLVLSLGLIEACVAAQVPRFVLSSTAAVYRSSDDPLAESSALGPVNVYGHTKLMIERALNWARRRHGLRYAALRYFNAAGALPDHGEAHQPESHLIPLVLQVALNQRPSIKIFGDDYPTPDGTCIRDYIHIADLVEAHGLALAALEHSDQLEYNLGNGTGYSVKEVIDVARQVTGHPIPAEIAPRRPGDAPRLVASAERIRRDLDWQPQHPSLEQIVGSAWEWHRQHPAGHN